MGNGHNRHHRGGGSRHGSHRTGGPGQGRATTHLVPPVSTPQNAPPNGVHATTRKTTTGDTHEEATTSREAAPSGGAVETMATADTSEAELAQEPAATENTPAHDHEEKREDSPGENATPVTPEEGADQPAHASQAPPSGRGRFERFYAPGQGPRVERGSPPAATPASSPEATATPAVPPPVVARPAKPAHRPEPIEREPTTPDIAQDEEDDNMEYTGPREDVRGSVGVLVDSLRDLFERDRSIASQGNVARCGVCYLHFPAADLTYREAEGFYVCHSCNQALGHARIPMARRQQRL